MGNITSRLCQSPLPNLSFKEMCQRMCCLVVCCDSEVRIDYSDASDEEEEQEVHEREISQESLSSFRETEQSRAEKSRVEQRRAELS